MNKLVKVIVLKDEYMEDGEQFCTKNKEYNIINEEYDELKNDEFKIIDDSDEEHIFVVNNCDYFRLVYEE